MRRLLKRTDTGEYAHHVNKWGPLNSEVDDSLSPETDRKTAHGFKRHYISQGVPCIIVIRYRKPKVSDGERAYWAFWKAVPHADEMAPFSSSPKGLQDAWHSAAKAARSRK